MKAEQRTGNRELGQAGVMEEWIQYKLRVSCCGLNIKKPDP